MTREVIKNKMPMRGVHNVDMSFINVEIPGKFKLPGVNSFKDVADMLAHSRLYVCWVAAGIACGVYDNVLKYIS